MPVVVYFIRHGETKPNHNHTYQGCRIDEGLTEKGILEAIKTRHEFEGKQVDVVYSSPMKRAVETAEVVFGEKVIQDDGFIERDLGEWTGKTKAYIKENLPEQYAPYQASRDMSSVKGAEPYEQFETRLHTALEHLLSIHNNKVVAVFSHGGPIKLLLAKIQGFPRSYIGTIKIENTFVVKVKFSGTTLETGTIKSKIPLKKKDV
jgi:alpha-ribazole phosphatase